VQPIQAEIVVETCSFFILFSCPTFPFWVCLKIGYHVPSTAESTAKNHHSPQQNGHELDTSHIVGYLYPIISNYIQLYPSKLPSLEMMFHDFHSKTIISNGFPLTFHEFPSFSRDFPWFSHGFSHGFSGCQAFLTAAKAGDSAAAEEIRGFATQFDELRGKFAGLLGWWIASGHLLQNFHYGYENMGMGQYL
jgi:hypothetical protein